MVVTISESLTASAKRYALIAADDFVSGHYAGFALASGIAVEHALKARLAAESPVFLAAGGSDARWFRSARLLWTHQDDAETFGAASADVQTITATCALDRMLVLDAKLKPLREHAERVFRCRNSEAHMGMAGAEEMAAALASCAKAVSEILDLPDDFYGDHAELVDALLDGLPTDLYQRVQLKLAAARHEFERRFGGELSSIRSTMLKVIEDSRTWRMNAEVRPYACPVCDSRALIEGTNTVETDYERHSDIPIETVWLHPARLTCEACHLVLDGTEELGAAGIDPEIENEGIDAGDVYVDFEPDEDWFRDR